MKPLLFTLATGAVTASVAVGGYVMVQTARDSAVEISPSLSAQPVSFVEIQEAEEDGGEETAPSVAPPLPSEPESTPDEPQKATPAKGALSGTYRCWSFNAGGAGGRCTSPPIVFSSGGTYSMSSEAGTYTVNGSTVTLSASNIRGPGTLTPDHLQITFNYLYNGTEYTMTYLK